MSFLDSRMQMWIIYLQCTLVTIATILGTGILGLPSTLAYSGLTPFIVTFCINYFAQVLIVILFTEIMVLCRNDDQMEYVEMPMDSYGTIYESTEVGAIDNPCNEVFHLKFSNLKSTVVSITNRFNLTVSDLNLNIFCLNNNKFYLQH